MKDTFINISKEFEMMSNCTVIYTDECKYLKGFGERCIFPLIECIELQEKISESV